MRGARSYFNVVPKEKDADITLTFDYDPKENSQLTGGITFYVFDRTGLRNMEAGATPDQANIAAGNLVKAGETKLQAKFKSVGMGTYTIMVINRSGVAANYTLSVGGGNFQE